MEYKLFRSFGSLDRDVWKHELVAVEYGDSILDVDDTLIKAAADDLAGGPLYAGCATSAYAPELVRSFRRVKRYAYEMMGIVSPPNAPKNVLIDFGVMEEPEERKA